MINPINKIWQWVLILAVSVVAAQAVGSPVSSLWVFIGVLVVMMVTFCRGNLEAMLSWYIVSLVSIQFIKRALFLGGPVPLSLYYQIQTIPMVLMVVLAVVAWVRFLKNRLVARDVAVGLFFLLGATITMVRAFKDGVMAEAFVSLTRYSGATVCYLIGRTLTPGVWKGMKKQLLWLFGITTMLGAAQLIVGPMAVDIQWSRYTLATSIEAAKVVAALAGGDLFRPYSSFSDPLAWAFFITFVWSVIEGDVQSETDSSGRWLLRRVVFVSCLAMGLSRSCLLVGLAMLFFSWVLRRWLLGRPLVLLATFSFAFFGIVYTVQYLLDNVITANWFPQFTSMYLERFTDIGTLTQRGYALDEFAQAVKDYAFVGVGWMEHSTLTLGVGSGLPLFQSHNGIVSLMLVVGLPGVLLVLWLFVGWMNGVTKTIRGKGPSEIQLRWATAMVLGYICTAFVSGQQFLNEFFWLMVGWTTMMSLSGGMMGNSNKPVDTAEVATRGAMP